MIEARAPRRHVRRAYDLLAGVYRAALSRFERNGILLGLNRAAIQTGESVLEVGFGPGDALREIARRTGGGGLRYGVDLSAQMVRRTSSRLARAGIANLQLRRGDARDLPFPDGCVDVVFSSYVMDLMPLDDLPGVLAEIRRVLRTGGRLVLVNFSKESAEQRTLWEKFHEILPPICVAYLMGGCRPVMLKGLVQEAGFEQVRREFHPLVPFATEVISARRGP